uniref:Uncharacterized protein n=1 Tax=Octopus bimaculoides TaxID=37653 RepID=A0A0L8HQX2_OCTBM
MLILPRFERRMLRINMMTHFITFYWMLHKLCQSTIFLDMWQFGKITFDSQIIFKEHRCTGIYHFL